MDCINRSAEIYIPKLKPFKIKNRPPAPWWDSECDDAIKERKRALYIYKQSPTLENFLNCNLISACTKKFLKHKAKQSSINWVSSLNKNVPSSSLWKQTKKMQRVPENSSKTVKNNDWIQEFFNKVSPPYVENAPKKHHSQCDFNHFFIPTF